MAKNIELIDRVCNRLMSWIKHESLFQYGQLDSILWIAEHLKRNGLIIADEVGLGKTRLALLVMFAYLEEGSNVAAVVPAGLLLQWDAETKKLNDAFIKEKIKLTHSWRPKLLRSYHSIFQLLKDSNENYPLANHKEGRFLLISQEFDIYRLKSGTGAHKIALPCITGAFALKMDGVPAHHLIRKWAREAELENKNELEKAASFLANQYIEKKYSEQIRSKDMIPSAIGDNKCDPEVLEKFQTNGEFRSLLLYLTGLLIGRLDLLVIDEAHKSKSYEGHDKTRLGRIVDEVIQYNKNSRRVSLTATPVELSSEEWKAILYRTGIDTKSDGYINAVSATQQFEEALKAARISPDEPTKIEYLIKSSNIFETSLARFVSRRRRINQDEMKQLLRIDLSGAHPHRLPKCVTIEIDELNSNWKKILLALEGQGLSAKGEKEFDGKQKQADIRYSSGLDCNFDEKVENPVGQESSRKVRRNFAWMKFQKNLTKIESHNVGNWLWSHPRILKSIEYIENLLEFENGKPKEKVLVFGRFNLPLQGLDDMLNASNILRIMDTDVLAYFPKVNAEQLNLIYFLYEKKHAQMSFSGKLSGQKMSKTQVMSHIEKAHKHYVNSSKNLNKIIERSADVFASDERFQKEFVQFQKMFSRHVDLLFEVIRSDVFDRLIYEKKEAKASNRELIYKYATESWADHFKNMNPDYNSNDSDDTKVSLENIDSEENSTSLLTSSMVEDYLKHDSRISFSHILNGNTSQSKRRAIQNCFNKAHVGPYIVVAQSKVGREGLNLHEECRKVFLFHPEWNPGVMEQQIGRVDRINSRWTKLAKEYIESKSIKHYPFIEVNSLVFKGTYDEHQASVLNDRRADMNAQLFGELLTNEQIDKVADQELIRRLQNAAPNFEPRYLLNKKK